VNSAVIELGFDLAIISKAKNALFIVRGCKYSRPLV